jgi:hypothetical protein
MDEKSVPAAAESSYSSSVEHPANSTRDEERDIESEKPASLKSTGSKSAADAELQRVVTDDERREYLGGGKLGLVVYVSSLPHFALQQHLSRIEPAADVHL